MTWSSAFSDNCRGEDIIMTDRLAPWQIQLFMTWSSVFNNSCKCEATWETPQHQGHLDVISSGMCPSCVAIPALLQLDHVVLNTTCWLMEGKGPHTGELLSPVVHPMKIWQFRLKFLHQGAKRRKCVAKCFYTHTIKVTSFRCCQENAVHSHIAEQTKQTSLGNIVEDLMHGQQVPQGIWQGLG